MSSQVERLAAALAAERAGRFAEAISAFDVTLREEPESREALLGLARCFRQTHALKAAAGVAIRATQLFPNDGEAAYLLGSCQADLLMLPQAADTLRRAARLAPESPKTLVKLGDVLHRLGSHDAAEAACRKAIAIDPESADGYAGLGRALLGLGRFREAVEFAERAVELDPELSSARILLAQVLVQDGRPREAQTHAEKAIELRGSDPLAHAVLGQALQSQGLLERANLSVLKSIEVNPRQGYSYAAYLFGKKVTVEDRRFELTMLELTRDPTVPQSDIESLHLALGRLYEGLGEYEKAITHYDQGNRIALYLKSRGVPFNRNKHRESRERVASFFTTERFGELSGAGLKTDLPIFVVGMMRSGTTLMEQILSRHPDVLGAGEQHFWTREGADCYDEAKGTLDPERLAALASRYLSILGSIGGTAPRVTDKMPGNSLMLGFIHAAFPNARIIHMIRDPADTSLSIYTTPNGRLIDYLHDKGNIAFAYRTQLRLMAHWRSVLPENRYMDVVYEDLIDDPESVTRRVLSFCGLEWSDLCLTPEKSTHAVVTPSAWQVRQPIYRSSIRRWKNFEPWIPEFASLHEGSN